MRIFVNLVAFQLGWLACVLAGAHRLPWLGVAFALVIIALHLRLATRPGIELRLLLVVAGLGSLWDGLLVGSGLLAYPSGMVAAWLPPIWMMTLWLVFATTLNVALRWLRGRWVLAALFGAVGGPVAFYTGSQLGGVVFVDIAAALPIIGAGWLVMTPIFVWLGERLDGQAAVDPPTTVPTMLAKADRHA